MGSLCKSKQVIDSSKARRERRAKDCSASCLLSSSRTGIPAVAPLLINCDLASIYLSFWLKTYFQSQHASSGSIPGVKMLERNELEPCLIDCQRVRDGCCGLAALTVAALAAPSWFTYTAIHCPILKCS